MSNATGTPDYRSVLSERFADRPAVAPLEENRSRAIAALHAIAFFFVDHLDVPTPRNVHLHVDVASRAELEALAVAHHTTVYGDRPQVSIRIELIPGMWATVLASIPQEDKPL